MSASSSRLPFLLTEVVQYETQLVDRNNLPNQTICELIEKLFHDLKDYFETGGLQGNKENELILAHFLRCCSRMLNRDHLVSRYSLFEAILQSIIAGRNTFKIARYQTEAVELLAAISVMLDNLQASSASPAALSSSSELLVDARITSLQIAGFDAAAALFHSVSSASEEEFELLQHATAHFLHFTLCCWAMPNVPVVLLQASLSATNAQLLCLQRWTKFWKASLPGVFSALVKLIMKNSAQFQNSTNQNQFNNFLSNRSTRQLPLRLRCEAFSLLCTLLQHTTRLQNPDTKQRLCWINERVTEHATEPDTCKDSMDKDNSASNNEQAPWQVLAQQLVAEAQSRLKHQSASTLSPHTSPSKDSQKSAVSAEQAEWRVSVLQRVTPHLQSLLAHLLHAIALTSTAIPPGATGERLQDMLSLAVTQLVRHSGDFLGTHCVISLLLCLAQFSASNPSDTQTIQDYNFIPRDCWSVLQRHICHALHLSEEEISKEQGGGEKWRSFYQDVRLGLWRDWTQRWKRLATEPSRGSSLIDKDVRILLCLSPFAAHLSIGGSSTAVRWESELKKVPHLTRHIQFALVSLFLAPKTPSESVTSQENIDRENTVSTRKVKKVDLSKMAVSNLADKEIDSSIHKEKQWTRFSVSEVKKIAFYPHRAMDVSREQFYALLSQDILCPSNGANLNKEEDDDDRYLAVYLADFELLIQQKYYGRSITDTSNNNSSQSDDIKCYYCFDESESDSYSVQASDSCVGLYERLAGFMLSRSIGLRHRLVTTLGRQTARLQHLASYKQVHRPSNLHNQIIGNRKKNEGTSVPKGKVVLSNSSDDSDSCSENNSDEEDDGDYSNTDTDSDAERVNIVHNEMDEPENIMFKTLRYTVSTLRLIFAYLQSSLRVRKMTRPCISFSTNSTIASQNSLNSNKAEELQCSYCGKSAKDTCIQMLRCSRCKMAVYCEPAHQKLHWPQHKMRCQSVKQPVLVDRSTSAITKSIMQFVLEAEEENIWTNLNGSYTLSQVLSVHPSLASSRREQKNDETNTTKANIKQATLMEWNDFALRLPDISSDVYAEFVAMRQMFFQYCSSLCVLLHTIYATNDSSSPSQSAPLWELLWVTLCACLQHMPLFYFPTLHPEHSERTDPVSMERVQDIKRAEREIQQWLSGCCYPMFCVATQDMPTSVSRPSINVSQDTAVQFEAAGYRDAGESKHLYEDKKSSIWHPSMLRQVLQRFGSETAATALPVLAAATALRRLSLSLLLRSQFLVNAGICTSGELHAASDSARNTKNVKNSESLRFLVDLCSRTGSHGSSEYNIVTSIITSAGLNSSRDNRTSNIPKDNAILKQVSVTDVSLAWLCATQLDRVVEGLCRDFRHIAVDRINHWPESSEDDSRHSAMYVATSGPRTLWFVLSLLRLSENLPGVSTSATPLWNNDKEPLLLLAALTEAKRLLVLLQQIQFASAAVVTLRHTLVRVIALLLRHLLLRDACKRVADDDKDNESHAHTNDNVSAPSGMANNQKSTTSVSAIQFQSLLQFHVSLRMHANAGTTEESVLEADSKNVSQPVTASISVTQRDTAKMCRELLLLLIPLLPSASSTPIASTSSVAMQHINGVQPTERSREESAAVTDAISLLLTRLHSLYLILPTSTDDVEEDAEEPSDQDPGDVPAKKGGVGDVDKDEKDEVRGLWLQAVHGLWQKLLPAMSIATKQLRQSLCEKAAAVIAGQYSSFRSHQRHTLRDSGHHSVSTKSKARIISVDKRLISLIEESPLSASHGKSNGNASGTKKPNESKTEEDAANEDWEYLSEGVLRLPGEGLPKKTTTAKIGIETVLGESSNSTQPKAGVRPLISEISSFERNDSDATNKNRSNDHNSDSSSRKGDKVRRKNHSELTLRESLSLSRCDAAESRSGLTIQRLLTNTIREDEGTRGEEENDSKDKSSGQDHILARKSYKTKNVKNSSYLNNDTNTNYINAMVSESSTSFKHGGHNNIDISESSVSRGLPNRGTTLSRQDTSLTVTDHSSRSRNSLLNLLRQPIADTKAPVDDAPALQRVSWLPDAWNLLTQMLCRAPSHFLRDRCEKVLWPLSLSALVCLSLLLQPESCPDAEVCHFGVALVRLCVTMCRRGSLPNLATQRAMRPLLDVVLPIAHYQTQNRGNAQGSFNTANEMMVSMEVLLHELRDRLSSAQSDSNAGKGALQTALWLRDMQHLVQSVSSSNQRSNSNSNIDTVRDMAQLAAAASILLTNTQSHLLARGNAPERSSNTPTIQINQEIEDGARKSTGLSGASNDPDPQYQSLLQRFSVLH